MDPLTPPPGLEHPEAAPDYDADVAREVVRGCWEGTRAVWVSGRTKARQQVTALLDLLELHLAAEHPLYAGQWVDERAVTLLVGPGATDEAVEALRTLRAEVEGLQVRLLVANQQGTYAAADDGPADLADPQASGWSRWPEQLLRLADEPPAWAVTMVEQLDVRLQPVQAAEPTWSLRTRGRSLGAVTAAGGWIESEGAGLTRQVLDPADTGGAAQALARYLTSAPGLTARQQERALVDELDTLAQDVRVKWSAPGPTHLLDALTTSGATQVSGAQGAGTGQRHRHALADVVLARRFLRQAAALDPWFDRHGLDRASTPATLVLAEPDYYQRRWAWRTPRLAALFDVEVLTL